MSFRELLLRAKAGDNVSIEALLQMYKPLLLKESIRDGTLDEDLYQELSIAFLRCVRAFKV